jgi:hypothetical protein
MYIVWCDILSICGVSHMNARATLLKERRGGGGKGSGTVSIYVLGPSVFSSAVHIFRLCPPAVI